jgi:hypothetical protein
MQTIDLKTSYQTPPTAEPPASTVKLRLRVRCKSCELAQWEAKTCRRCREALPKPMIEYVEVEKPIPIYRRELVEVPSSGRCWYQLSNRVSSV